MKALSTHFSKAMDVLEKVLRVILGVSMFVMLVVMIYQVVLRYVFNAANIWSEELARYLMCYCVLLGAAIAIRHTSHLQVDVLIGLLKPKARHIAVVICTLAGIVFMCYFCQFGITLCESTVTSISAGTGIPMAYVYACLPIGGALMILASVEVILKELVGFVECGKEEATK